MRRWVDKVPAVLQAWYPGQEGGTALAEVLLGEVNPSGHLPATFERRLEDNPAYANWFETPGTNRIEYKEGVFTGYRGFEQAGTAPLFPFGLGLSYTSFEYANLTVTPVTGTGGAPPHWDVAFDITNSGARAGTAVAQLYVASPAGAVPRPPKELQGFARVVLQPGEKKRVTIPVTLRSLAYYDVSGHDWRADRGTYKLLVGNSAADTPLSGSVSLARFATTQ